MGLPLSFSNLLAEVVEDAVDDVGRLQVGAVVTVVGTLRVLHQPGTVLGGVVEDQVRDGENAPLLVHLGDEAL